ncbi:MAG: tetratricopeptide repeat protein [Anaerolineae bacterium]
MENLDRQLGQLENAQIVRRIAGEDLEYQFKHALMQDAAYNSLLVKRRREIHQRVAECIERIYPQRLDEFAAVLAQHYAEAGDERRTLEHAARAGDLAARVYANAESITQYTRALVAAERTGAPGSRVAYLYTRRGRAYELSGQYAQALENYAEMASLAHRRGDPALELESLMLCAIIRATPTRMFDPAQARALTDRALALARDLQDRAAEAKALWIRGLLHWFTSHTPEATQDGEASLALARQFNLREQLAFTLNNLGYPYFSAGRTDEALATAAEACELWRELDNQPMLADTLGNLAEHGFALGEYEPALRHGAQALRLSQGIGSLWGQSFSQFYTGHIYWERGEPDRAIPIMRDCIRLAEEAGFAVPQFGTRADLGWVYAGLGAIETGLELVRTAQRIAQSFPVFRSWTPATLARIHLHMGDIAAAQKVLRQAHASAPPDYIGNLYPTDGCVLAFAEIELALAQAEHTAALAIADPLIHFLEGARLRTFLPEARYLAAQARLGQGERDRALQELVAGREVAEAIGSRRILWQTLFMQSQLEAERGDAAAARTLCGQAREIVVFIVDHTPPDLRESFLNTPEVRAVMTFVPSAL